MRLQLRWRAGARAAAAFVMAGAACAVTSPARADWSGGVDGRSSIYQDTDRTTIWTTIVGAHVSPKDVITFNGHYLADVITSASIDVISTATTRGQCAGRIPGVSPAPSPTDKCDRTPPTQQPFHETRHEGAGSFVYADGTNTARLGYVYSRENDWRSHSFSAAYSRELLNKRLTLGLGGSFTTNDVFRQHDDNFRQKLSQGSASLDAGIIASKRDFITLGYTFMYLKGYQSSPYRGVKFGCPTPQRFSDWFDCANGALEGDARTSLSPDQRIRHAMAVRWNRHLFQDVAIKSHLRGYVDSWGVVSATVGTEYVVGFGDLELGVFVRGYAQKGANFWADIYDTKKRYMTADRELSPFLDAFGGLRFGYLRERRLGIFQALKAEVKVTAFAFKFLDFVRLPQREGVVGEIALGGAL